jgi:lipoprotein-anchoring transpeptidase ErfK/SrfK
MGSLNHISRRDTLKLAALGLGGLTLRPWNRIHASFDFPSSERLGRVCVRKTDIKARPDGDSQNLGALNEDAVVPWLREVAGRPYSIYASNLRWVETPDGYVWAPHLQPVVNQPNQPTNILPETSLGAGMWVEVTVPWVDLTLDNPPARSPWLKNTDFPRLYYSQIIWVDQSKTSGDGQTYYRINERYGYGDFFWAAAEAFRPLTPEDTAPIHPEAEEKRVIVNLRDQTLSCYEGNIEVFFCRISSGAKFDAQGNPVDEWSTPLGPHHTWRKTISLHMSGGTTGGGYDLPGIGWTTIFAGNGVAIHSTYWHNNFGEPMSHGCVNARPRDAQWVFRWSDPQVDLYPGDLTVSMPGGTVVEVLEG